MIVQSAAREGSGDAASIAKHKTNDISITVPRRQLADARAALEKLAREVGAGAVTSDEKIGLVSIVGVGMKSHAGVASKAFRALTKIDGVKY